MIARCTGTPEVLRGCENARTGWMGMTVQNVSGRVTELREGRVQLLWRWPGLKQRTQERAASAESERL